MLTYVNAGKNAGKKKCGKEPFCEARILLLLSHCRVHTPPGRLNIGRNKSMPELIRYVRRPLKDEAGLLIQELREKKAREIPLREFVRGEGRTRNRREVQGNLQEVGFTSCCKSSVSTCVRVSVCVCV